MKYFEHEAAIIHLTSIEDRHEDIFINKLRELIADYSERKRIHQVNTLLFDGYGLVRVYEKIFHLVNQST